MFDKNKCSCREYNKVIMEPTINKCTINEIYHEALHVVPIHTHFINKHIYNHTYIPEYSCSSENQVINNECGCNKNFFNR